MAILIVCCLVLSIGIVSLAVADSRKINNLTYEVKILRNLTAQYEPGRQKQILEQNRGPQKSAGPQQDVSQKENKAPKGKKGGNGKK